MFHKPTNPGVNRQSSRRTATQPINVASDDPAQPLKWAGTTRAAEAANQAHSQALGRRRGPRPPVCGVRLAGAAAKLSSPHGHGTRDHVSKVRFIPRALGCCQRETPTFPVPGERLVAITHTFRHIF